MSNEQQRRKLFEECVERCADSLYRVAFRLTGNQTLASELVQETYLNAWQDISKLKSEDRIRSWMFAILRNQYTKLLRREVKAVNVIEQISDAPHSDGADTRLTEQVNDAIAQLKESQRIIVLLVSMEGFSINETAELLDLPRGTVLSRLHRGRESLKQILQHELEMQARTH